MNDLTIDAAIALGGFLLYLFAATAEASVAALSRTRVHQMIDHGRLKARRLEVILENPTRYCVSAQILRTIGAVLTIAGSAFLARGLQPSEERAWLMVALVTAGLILVKAVPRGLATHNAEETVLRLFVAVRAGGMVLWPVVRGLDMLGATLAHLVGLGASGHPHPQNGDDANGRDAVIVEPDEQEMIDAVIELDKTTVRELMVPRMDVVALAANSTVDHAVAVISEHGYSRVPIYEGSIDQVVGVLYAKDLFKHLRSGDLSVEVRGLVRSALFIPESKKTDDLLRELQKEKVHMAIVIDEYGGTAGVVTIEDLLEEIVGEIQDEYDREEAKIVEVSGDEAIFDATVSIGDVNDLLKLELEGEDVDTIGGLLYERLGKVPTLGDRVEAGPAVLRVESVAGRRIKKVRVTRRAEPTSTTRAA